MRKMDNDNTITPAEFCKMLSGFVKISNIGAPTTDQWKSLTDIEVKNTMTPFPDFIWQSF